LKEQKEGDELIVPIGANSLIYVTLSATDKVIVMIGGGISAEKDPDSSVQYLTSKKTELENSHRELAGLMQKVEQEAQKVQARLQAITSTQDGGRGASLDR
jgi:prefoldin alpha subunit